MPLPPSRHPSTEHWARVDRYFQEALLLLPDQRSAYLDLHCKDPLLRAAVEELLAFTTQHQASFEADMKQMADTLWHDLTHPTPPRPVSLIGHTIGAYRLLDQRKAEGQEATFRAERIDDPQQEPFLVTVFSGEPLPDRLLRFYSTCEILSRLAHPNIARVNEGGITAFGDLYLVGEYVEGLSITAYADLHHLDLRQRLALFLTVCHALQDAHQAFVFHRDLTPADVLVTNHGLVKVLHVGRASLLADAFGRSLAGDTLPDPTAHPAPELLRGDLVTTATDVYALGAMLFELVLGYPPFSPEAGAFSGLALPTEEANAVSQEAPPLTLRERAALRRTLRRDLGAILQKALQTDPSRRYATALHLADDIQRYLDGFPVSARPRTAAYRSMKFTARHWRVLLLLISAAALGLFLANVF